MDRSMPNCPYSVYMYCTVQCTDIMYFFLCRSKLVIKQKQNQCLSAYEERSLILQFFVIYDYDIFEIFSTFCTTFKHILFYNKLMLKI